MFQEENKILDKMHRQKDVEGEKLCKMVHELEEVVLSGGVAANAVGDYRRQVNELIVSSAMPCIFKILLLNETLFFFGCWFG